MLGDEAVCSPYDRSYLEGLAEAYKNSAAWDTRRQILSVMAGIASYKAISLFIPGITPYRYTMANLHRLQFGRAAPVPKKDAPRLRIDRQQLDHFLSFITSPHLVHFFSFQYELILINHKIGARLEKNLCAGLIENVD